MGVASLVFPSHGEIPDGVCMYSSISQIVALVIYGNRFLQTGHTQDFISDTPRTALVGGCQSVTFLDWHSPESMSPTQFLAQTPQQWYERLRNDGVHGLRLHIAGQATDDERAPAVFRGGLGFWLLLRLPGCLAAWVRGTTWGNYFMRRRRTKQPTPPSRGSSPTSWIQPSSRPPILRSGMARTSLTRQA